MDENNITSLSFAEYRLERAKEDLASAKLNYEHNLYKSANNRAYYAIFHAIRAVLALERVDFKKHKDVLAYFNKNYVKTEKFPKKMGHKIVVASNIREDSDYDDEFIACPEKTLEQIQTAEKLIKLVEEYLKKQQIKIYQWLNL